MHTLLKALAALPIALGALAPAEAAVVTVNATNWLTTTDAGGNNIALGALCGASSATTLATQCAYQVEAFSDGGLGAHIVNSVAVTGTFWQATQPVSAASLPLPSGAATSANQTSVESAPGTPQTTALTVQGNASGVPVPVSGSVAVQPASGVGWTPAVKTGLTNSAQSVKGSAGTLGVTHCDNANAATVYVEFFNVASPTLGTTAPTWVVPIPTGGGGEGFVAGLALGGSAISVAAVTAYNGSTAPTSTLTCSIGTI